MMRVFGFRQAGPSVAVLLFGLIGCRESTTDVTDPSAEPMRPGMSADAGLTAANGKIAFVSNRDNVIDDEIYIMNADGSGQTRLTNYAGLDDEPAWSPDGTKIAFRRNVANADGGLQGDIYVMNADGSGQANITNGPALDGSPAWSPDGTKIAFSRTVEVQENENIYNNQDIYVMNADGTALVRLTFEAEPDREPAWSPDGTKIAFISLRDDPGDEFSKSDVFVMNSDGTAQTNLTNSTAIEANPAWSPDGTKLAFARANALGGSQFSHFEIFVMNADGTGQTNVTNHTATDYGPAWSPDGTRLAFSSDRSPSTGAPEIWTMSPDGSELVMLTNSAGNRSPAWQPLPITPPYAFSGFFQPVDNLPTANVAKAGSGIPIKFSLGGDQGLDIFLAGFPKFVAEPCDPSDQQDPLETSTNSPSGLSYDQASSQYTYVWKTSRALADHCGRFVLGLKDGSDHVALVRFTR